MSFGHGDQISYKCQVEKMLHKGLGLIRVDFWLACSIKLS